MVMAQGFSREEVESILDDYSSSKLIEQPIKALLAYAEKTTQYPDQLSEQDIQKLHQHGLEDDKILEATMVAAVFNMMDRLADALGAPVEYMQDKIEKIQKVKGTKQIMP